MSTISPPISERELANQIRIRLLKPQRVEYEGENDMWRKTWHTILDIPSGCRRNLFVLRRRSYRSAGDIWNSH